MLAEIVVNANVVQVLGGITDKIAGRLFRNSGWSIPDDTDTGISFGDLVEGGGGYMEMDVQDNRSEPKKKYEIRGGYVELGVGFGEISKGKAIIEKLVKAMKGFKFSSDLVVLPGGSIGSLIMGPMQDKANLQVDDFKNSSWLYVHIGGEAIAVSGDIGLMFMIEQKLSAAIVAGGASALLGNPGGLISALMTQCLAWSPYWGISVGLGAGGKFAVRFIQTVQMNPT